MEEEINIDSFFLPGGILEAGSLDGVASQFGGRAKSRRPLFGAGEDGDDAPRQEPSRRPLFGGGDDEQPPPPAPAPASPDNL